MTDNRPGRYIVASGTGLGFKGSFKRLNSILALNDSDVRISDVVQHIEKGLLKYMGPLKSIQKPEVLGDGDVQIVEPAPLSQAQDSVEATEEKVSNLQAEGHRPEGLRPLKFRKTRKENTTDAE